MSANSVFERLTRLGITLPEPAEAVAAYTPALVFGNTVRTSGQLPIVDGKMICQGTCGEDCTEEEAYSAARQCALNAISAAAKAAGGIDHLARVIKVTGFVASTPSFHAQPQVINGASEILQDIFESKHARSAVGVSALPLNSPVEVEVEFELI